MKKLISIIRIIKQDNAHLIIKSITHKILEIYHCLLLTGLIFQSKEYGLLTSINDNRHKPISLGKKLKNNCIND